MHIYVIHNGNIQCKKVWKSSIDISHWKDANEKIQTLNELLFQN